MPENPAISPDDPPSVARGFITRGFAPIPVPPLSVDPSLPDWQNFRAKIEDVEVQFPQAGNIGLLNGVSEKRLVVVRLNCVEARRAASRILPFTEMICGRESAPDSDWWYWVDESPTEAVRKFEEPLTVNRQNRPLLVELRSTGAVTLVPPSVYPAEPENGYPNSERCVWSQSGKGEGSQVNINELTTAVAAVAAAALFGHYWPRGARLDAGRTLADILLRAGWDKTRCQKFLYAVCDAAEDSKFIDYNRYIHREEGPAPSSPIASASSVLVHLGQTGRVLSDCALGWLAIPIAANTDATAPATITTTERSTPADPPRLPPEFEWPAPPEELAFHGLAGRFRLFFWCRGRR